MSRGEFSEWKSEMKRQKFSKTRNSGGGKKERERRMKQLERQRGKGA